MEKSKEKRENMTEKREKTKQMLIMSLIFMVLGLISMIIGTQACKKELLKTLWTVSLAVFMLGSVMMLRVKTEERINERILVLLGTLMAALLMYSMGVAEKEEERAVIFYKIMGVITGLMIVECVMIEAGIILGKQKKNKIVEQKEKIE